SGDGEVVCVHDATVGRGLRKKRVSATSAEGLAAYGVPRMADVYAALGSDFECSVDVEDEVVAPALLGVARDAGALSRLSVGPPHVELLESLRADREVKLVHSSHKRAIAVPLERHASDLASLGIDAMNTHYTEWTAGLVSLFHRFDIRAFAWDVQE